VMYRSDLNDDIYQEQLKRAEDRFQKFLETGVYQKVNFGTFVVPHFSTKVIASRDIVIGSYLGTDNLVQLADTVGLSVDGGAYLGTEGLPANWQVSADVRANLMRAYTHLKPIKSMKRALKEPFKNMIVPILKRKWAHSLDDIFDEQLNKDLTQNPQEWMDTTASGYVKKYNLGADFMKIEKTWGDDPAAQAQQKLRSIWKAIGDNLKNQMGVGESIIVTDTIGGYGELNAGYSVTDEAKVLFGVSANAVVISRLHIHRRDENTIQIYKDLGHVEGVGFNFTFKVKIPIITLSLKAKHGGANVKFYSVDLKMPEKYDPSYRRRLVAIREALLTNSLEMMEGVDKPFHLKHQFVEKDNEARFLFWQYKNLNSQDNLVVDHPEGGQVKLYRRLMGERTGKNYAEVINDLLDWSLSEALGTDVITQKPDSGNPGDSILGKSIVRQTSFEVEMDAQTPEYFQHPFVNLTYQWKGWYLSYKGLKEIVDQINSKYHFKFYPETVLNNTQSFQLYSIFLEIYFYPAALDKIKTYTSKDYYRLVVKQTKDDDVTKCPPKLQTNCRTKEDKAGLLSRQFVRFQKKYLKAEKLRNIADLSKSGSEMVSLLEESLTIDQMMEVAGKDNIYVNSRLVGFLKGDERGDRPVISHGIGQINDLYYA
ncbi:MAG: hypothetical protein WCG27_11450, partial [Pseudomonadota bacterium]